MELTIGILINKSEVCCLLIILCIVLFGSLCPRDIYGGYLDFYYGAFVAVYAAVVWG